MIYFWGCSDDCIELDGDLNEEIYGDTAQLVLSNGLRAEINYTGDWSIKVLHVPMEITWDLHPAGSEKAVAHTGRDYTDVLTVYGDVEWAVLGKYVASA